jgi:hypothetical protein
VVDRAVIAFAWTAALCWGAAALHFAEPRLLVPTIGCAAVAIIIMLTSPRTHARRAVWTATRRATQRTWDEYNALTELAQAAGKDRLPAIHAQRAVLLRSLGYPGSAAEIERTVQDLEIEQHLKGRIL